METYAPCKLCHPISRLRNRLVSASLLNMEGFNSYQSKVVQCVTVVGQKTMSVKRLSQGKEALKLVYELDFWASEEKV